MEDKNNNYYVYEWIRLDTNEPFYVGKGKDDRWKILNRNKNYHFNNIVKSIPVAVNILHENLDGETANQLEIWYIWQYRDIIGYDLVNICDGGEGRTAPWNEEQRKIMSERNLGENNPMYGKNPYEMVDEEKREEWKRKIGESSRKKWENKEYRQRMKNALGGERSANYGKHLSEETKEKIRQKATGKKYSNETKDKLSKIRKGKSNPRAKSVICLTTKRIFATAKEGAEYYKIKSSSNIISCCKNRLKFAGKYNNKNLVWKYLIWKHDKIYRILKGVN